MSDRQYRTHSEADTTAFGEALGGALQAGDDVLLSGDLGTGKSVLARGIARALGVSEPMPSPTFTILIPYEGEKPLYHFDLYRIEDPEEFYAAGLNEFLGGNGVCVVEWPERAELSGTVRLTLLRGGDDDARTICVSCPERPELLHAIERWGTDD